MSARKRVRRSSAEVPDIDITAFMNLMVVLIPFLLLSAAFNHLTVLDLYLPAPGYAQQDIVEDDGNKFELQLVITKENLVLQDKYAGVIKTLPNKADGQYDINSMQRQLASVKASHRDVTRITLLSEPQIQYETLILLMDNVRTLWIEDAKGGYLAELFPDISLGEAPDKEPEL